MSKTSLTELLRLASAPVAITFVDAAPLGVPHVSAVEPAGCGYWRRAAAGEVFFTVADDHKRCLVGAHTHNVTLSPAEKQEMMGLVQTMVGLSYLKMEDVPQIPTRKTALQVAVYAPLAAAPAPPDVVLVRGRARQIMLVAEAARAAGIAGDGAAMGRPACAMIPAVLGGPTGVTSLGCIGNRVYTGLGDDELYFTIPGPKIGDVVERLETVVDANRALETYHEGRRASV